ncbi:RNA-processing protein [Candidatus Woesearchaeota archaeon]|nr:RNA-processing protein [Candidatus Woesearchaeota archaeon]
MEEFSYELKIPKDRIAVLIGKDGETKEKIESSTNTKIDVDSKEGEITVIGKEALSLYTAREIIKAVARGVNPEIALELLKPDHSFELIDINQYAKNKQNHLQRIKGRIIGREGKTRQIIEELTNTHISVYGKTVSIIGEYEWVTTAKRAVESLITGSPHSSVYKWLEKKRQQLTKEEYEQKDKNFLKNGVSL